MALILMSDSLQGRCCLSSKSLHSKDIVTQTYTKTSVCLVAQSCLCDPMDCSLPGSPVHGDSPGKNTGVGCHALLQGIFLIQGSNPGLPNCRQILYHLSHLGSPILCLKTVFCTTNWRFLLSLSLFFFFFAWIFSYFKKTSKERMRVFLMICTQRFNFFLLNIWRYSFGHMDKLNNAMSSLLSLAASLKLTKASS